MVRQTCAPEQIINRLREAEILLNQGTTVSKVSRKIGYSSPDNHKAVALFKEAA